MKFQIAISLAASKDVDRLELWLLDKNPDAAFRVGEVVRDAIASLQTLAERGRPVGSGVRELNARLGGSVYVIRYQVSDGHVVVTRIFHGRERR